MLISPSARDPCEAGIDAVKSRRRRTMSPAPMRSMNDAATSATMSVRRSSLRRTMARDLVEMAVRRGPSRRDTAGRIAATVLVRSDTTTEE